MHLGAQWPTLLSGVYCEGWHSTGQAAPRSRDAFVGRIREATTPAPSSLLVLRLSAADAERVRAALPLHDLWPG